MKWLASNCAESRPAAAWRWLTLLALWPCLSAWAGTADGMPLTVTWLGWGVAALVGLGSAWKIRALTAALKAAQAREAHLRAAPAQASPSAPPALPPRVEPVAPPAKLPRRELQDTLTQLQDALRALQKVQEATAEEPAEIDSPEWASLAPALEALEGAATGIGEKFTRLHERTDEIANTVKALDKVSERINLLSLNAAIESEKAGDRGHGFVAIAQEIRRLADQTAATSLTIARQVSRAREVVSEGVMSVERFQSEVQGGVGTLRDARPEHRTPEPSDRDEQRSTLARAQRACDGAAQALTALLQADRGG